MSVALDVNVLLYASDPESSQHKAAMAVLDRARRGPELLCLPWTTVMAYLRISTHPRIFANPLTPEQACQNIESLLESPNVRTLAEGDGFWERYRDLIAGLYVRGNLVPDAHLAALLVQHGVRTLITRDKDLRRFSGFNVEDPFTP